MQFTQVGRFLLVSRITGPTHNLLGLDLSRDLKPETIVVTDLADGRTEKRLSKEDVRSSVVEGVDEANAKLGTRFRVVEIQFLSTYSPPPRVYKELAIRIVERFAKSSTDAAP